MTEFFTSDDPLAALCAPEGSVDVRPVVIFPVEEAAVEGKLAKGHLRLIVVDVLIESERRVQALVVLASLLDGFLLREEGLAGPRVGLVVDDAAL